MRWLIIFFLLTGTAMAGPVPTGVASYYDSVTGDHTNSFGAGGTPVLNYHDGDKWIKIVDDWIQVGERQIWKSVVGGHRAWADSTGAAIYAKGNHYLGTKTTKLIKFNKADSTWKVLYDAEPDSILVSGNIIVFYGIFPGIDMWLQNKPKVFEAITHRFVFNQEARDLLVGNGPWAGHLLGVVTVLNTDSLNVTWSDAQGIFGIDPVGRTTDGYIEALDGEVRVFAMPRSFIETRDSTTSIPVYKRLVSLNGKKYLIEMFNPVLAAQLPDGPISHNATYGQSSSANGGALTTTDQVVGGIWSALPADSTGSVTSLTAYLETTGGPVHYISLSIASHDGQIGDSIMHTTLGEKNNQAVVANEPEAFDWEVFTLGSPVAITGGQKYTLWMWGKQNVLGTVAFGYYVTSGGSATDSLAFYSDDGVYDWSSNGNGTDWPGDLHSRLHIGSQPPMIYATYTVSGFGRRLRVTKLLR